MKNRTSTYHQFKDGPEVELPILDDPPSGFTPMELKVGDRWIVGYLVIDTAPTSTEDMIGDGMGLIYSFHRSRPKEEHERALRALGRNEDEKIEPDPDAVLLDCYEHGQQYWSVHGEGMQCQFDTARGAGVWVPDKYLRASLPSDTKERREKAIECARQFLEQYNAVINGDVYGIVVAWYDEEGTMLGEESTWGFVGNEYAEQSLKEEFVSYCHTLSLVEEHEAS